MFKRINLWCMLDTKKISISDKSELINYAYYVAGTVVL